MKTETNTTFWYALISCNLRFDLDCQYLPLKYYTCGKHRAYLKNFFLFLSIPSFSLSNWFRTKTIGCHNDCSIIFPSHYSLFLTLIGHKCNLKIPSILLQNFFLPWSGNFFQAICSQSAYSRDVSERSLINQLKWVENIINWEEHWVQIAIRINWQAINDVKRNLAPSLVVALNSFFYLEAYGNG